MKVTKSQKYLIQDSFVKLENKQDFLDLLNTVKKMMLGDSYFPFKINQLNYYINTFNELKKDSPRHYKVFEIPKKSGGVRQIYAPHNGLLQIQKVLNCILQCVHQPHPAAYGFIIGKSITDNAQKHINQGYVFNIDLKDFFPSVASKIVYGRLLTSPFNLGSTPQRKKIANYIKALTTAPLGNDQTLVLPQGAPTSPTLSNAVCDYMDKKLSRFAKNNKMRYSRYADDITFSSNDKWIKSKQFEKELREIIVAHNFKVNENKVRLHNQAYRQEVTGIVVNKKLNVNRKYIKQLRHWIYVWEKYGLSVAQKSYMNAISGNMIAPTEKSIHLVLGGKLDYLKMVKGPNDPTFKKLQNRYKDLVPDKKPKLERNKYAYKSKNATRVHNSDAYVREVQTKYKKSKILLDFLSDEVKNQYLKKEAATIEQATIVDNILNQGLEQAMKNWNPNE